MGDACTGCVGRARVIGVIPARWASTRFPGKSLVPICGKPLIQWVVEGAQRAARLDLLLVATDDERICEVVRGLGVEAVMTGSDHPSGTDRVAEAVAGRKADVVINIQGDEPLMSPDLIDTLAEVMLSEDEWDMATAATPLADSEHVNNPSVVKVVCDCRNKALYFSRSVVPFIRDDDFAADDVVHWCHMGIYAYRRSFLDRLVVTPPCLLEKAERLEQLRALDIGGRIAVVRTADRAIGVDTPEDVAYVEELLREREQRG